MTALTLEVRPQFLQTTLPDIPDERFVRPTAVIDSDHPAIIASTQEVVRGKSGDIEKAVVLFYFVRDAIHYNLFVPREVPDHFKASRTLANGEGYCVTKACLLAAMARAAGIPAGLGFARIRNWQLPEKTLQRLKTNILPFHGYTELYLGGRWVKATPAWDARLSDRLGSSPVEFDGRSDALLPAANRTGAWLVQYLKDLGHYDDVPLEKLWAALEETYGGRTLTR
jgi:transglutaminase-like putative cysteine protease